MNRLLQIFNVALVYTLLAAPLCAELTRFEITDREPFADGHKFGTVGE